MRGFSAFSKVAVQVISALISTPRGTSVVFADDSRVRSKNDVPKNRRHAVVTIIDAMMRKVPHLYGIEPGVWFYRPAVHGKVSNDKSQIS